MKRKLISFLLLVFMLFGASSCAFSLNTNANAKVIVSEVFTESKHIVVIKIDKTTKGATLMDAMRELKKGELLAYKTAGTMITSINGVDNAADYSACWMLYTSDDECANGEWGVVEYKSQTYGSAIVGADALEISEGELYIWKYENF